MRHSTDSTSTDSTSTDMTMDLAQSLKSHRILQKCLLTVVLLSGAFFLHIRLVYAVVVSVILNFALGDLTLKVLWKTLPRDLRGAVGLLGLRCRMWRFLRQKSTVAEDFRRVAQRHPLKRALLYEEQVWTFRDVDAYANQVAHYFAAGRNGFSAGDTVALFLMSRPEYVCLWLGLSRAGCVASLVNFNLRGEALVHSLIACQAKAIVVGLEFLEVVVEIRARLPFLPVLVVAERGRALPHSLPSGATGLDDKLIKLPVEPPVIATKTGPKDRLFYIYTSGTTGLPKAAVITNTRFFYLACGIKSMIRIFQDDVIYCTLPLYHTGGGILGVGQCLLFGSTVVIRKKFSASQFWLDCSKYNCTVAQYIGEMCRYLLVQKASTSDKAHKLRLMFGNGLKSEIWTKFQERFGVKQMGEFYGATEGNASVTNTDNTIGAVGFLSRILPSVYPVMLIRLDSATGEPLRDSKGMAIRCKPGEPGELVGRIKSTGIHTFDGYSNKDANSKKITRDVFRKGDLAFLSGDILVMDEYGYMFFRDRTGDTFRWRGENVSTAQVEAAISQIVGLEAVVVFGVEVPACEGKAGMVCLTGNVAAFDLNKLNAEMKHSLPSYARPLFLRFLTQVDQTGTFKLIKSRLKEEAFDPRKTSADALFYFDAQNDDYRPLTLDVFNQIACGSIRY
ncbi:Long-chain fatty acid transport protein 4 [Hypsibius exemplaris]|uniref:Very long-chain fatty acid transport protein n=1 Tax=Hypsibius exemplaris TaxID=2072580 RepID=A0A1W0X9M6_HYPEX|nr:Long-chain fatty acid transport protein 4 [Hypsibius exemplaris]